MDGASKFVRGDAIAGLLITLINIIGGIIIGVMQMGMSLGAAGASYTLLTIGDGLVSQIPALIVSVAAGLLVSKAGVDGAADKAMLRRSLLNTQKRLRLCPAYWSFSRVMPGLALPAVCILLAGGIAARPMAAAQKKDKKEET